MATRADFPSSVKETLARRVGLVCSRPECGRSTSGPHANVNKALNIGVAAHISAASPGGPRYNAQQTTEERGSIQNGIWLCPSCHDMVDGDPLRYTVAVLLQWKAAAEEAAHRKIEEPTARPAEIARSKLSDLVLSHRRAVERRARGLTWWDHPIALELQLPGKLADARQYISQWCASDRHDHLLIVGEPGSGKSGLAIWGEYEFQRRDEYVTLMVPADRLRSAPMVDLELLFAEARPALQPEAAASIVANYRLALILDGLDELLGGDLNGDAATSRALTELAACLPPDARIVATCRKAAAEKIGDILRDRLPDRAADDDSFHQTVVISKALGSADLIEQVEINPVLPEDATNFLVSGADAVITPLLEDKRWARFLTSPMLLTLLKEVMPTLVDDDLGAPALDKIYALYVRHALIRNIPGIREAGMTVAIEGLQRVSNVLDPRVDEADLHPGLQAGLLTRDRDSIRWVHYTLWEYFFATLLFGEIKSHQADTLAQMDLVNAYHVNCLLVPMLNRLLRRNSSRRDGSVHLVTPREYQQFREATGWRQATGYGIHPSVARSRDGVPSSSFAYDRTRSGALHNDYRHGHGTTQVACQVSWYDAAAYAIYAGARIPTSAELFEASPSGDFVFWASDWADEKIAHLSVLDTGLGKIEGLNPDVRLERTAIAIVA